MHLAFALAIVYMPKNCWVNIKIIAFDSTHLAIQYQPNKMNLVSKTTVFSVDNASWNLKIHRVKKGQKLASIPKNSKALKKAYKNQF